MMLGTAYHFDENAQTMRESLVQQSCGIRLTSAEERNGGLRPVKDSFVVALDLRFPAVIYHDTHSKMIDVKYPLLRAHWPVDLVLELHVVYRTNLVCRLLRVRKSQ